MDAHAPPPWKVVPYVDAIDIVDANGDEVAHLADRDLRLIGMPPANARLIAAAPDLLAACKQVLAAGEEWAGTKAWDMCRDAVAEAEGRGER